MHQSVYVLIKFFTRKTEFGIQISQVYLMSEGFLGIFVEKNKRKLLQNCGFKDGISSFQQHSFLFIMD